jgi:hypothetical protein
MKGRGGGRAPPTLTSLGSLYPHDGMYARKQPPLLLCVLCAHNLLLDASLGTFKTIIYRQDCRHSSVTINEPQDSIMGDEKCVCFVFCSNPHLNLKAPRPPLGGPEYMSLHIYTGSRLWNRTLGPLPPCSHHFHPIKGSLLWL